MIITIPPSVQIDTWELPYIRKSLAYLEDLLNDNYNFIISRNDEYLKKSIINYKKNILILISDEIGLNNEKSGPYFMKNNIYMIFRTYNNRNLYDENWIFPIPCGFSGGVSYQHSCDGKMHYYKDFEKEKKKLSEREYDIFFSGNISTIDRQKCINKLNSLSKNKYKILIKTTNSFAKGYPLEEYYELMSNSKISMVPRGVVIPESFRYFESFECNCITISTYPIYDNNFKHWYNENSPAIFLNSWDHLSENILDELLKENKLIYYENENKKYFDNYLSTKSLSNYILNKIIEYEKNKNK